MMVRETCCRCRVTTFLILAVLLVLPDRAVHAAIDPDAYEPDNSSGEATVIVLNYHTSQNHTFYPAGDEDWVQFFAIAGETYKIKAANTSYLCDPIIELYGMDGETVLDSSNATGPDEDEYLLWTCPENGEGIYYVRVTNAIDYWGANVWYDLSVDIPGAFSLPGYVTGRVTSGGQGIGGAALKSGNGSGLTLPDGSYILSLEEGTRTILVSKSGYFSQSFTVSISGGSSYTRNVELVPIENDPPVISGITDTTVRAGHHFSLLPTASDPDGDPITFSITGSPAWTNFDPARGELSGDPGVEHIGSYGPVIITATDGHGASASLPPFTLTVVSPFDGLGFLPAVFHILVQGKTD